MNWTNDNRGAQNGGVVGAAMFRRSNLRCMGSGG